MSSTYIAGVAANKNGFNQRVKTGDHIEDFPAVFTRHYHVQDDEACCILVFVENPDGGFPVGGLQDGITLVQRTVIIIFLTSASSSMTRIELGASLNLEALGGCVPGYRIDKREIYVEGGPLKNLTCDVDVPTVLFHDAIDARRPGPFPCLPPWW